MIYSTLTHPLPKPSRRYARTARELRQLDWYVNPNNHDFLDDYHDQLQVLRENYPDLRGRRLKLLAIEGVLLNRLDEVHGLMSPVDRASIA